jgi:L-threonylcarbamoyladenylate synthase
VNTLRFPVDPERLTEPEAQSALEAAAAILRRGGTVALPTETVYGLGANALDEKAVADIFAAKGRPGWDPLIVHVADEAMLARVAAEISPRARRLMDAFWPGPLTMLLRRSAAIPDAVTAGRPLVGVRMPAHPVALELIRRAGVPIAAPSANRFGHTSPTTAQHVLDDLEGRIDAVVDAGATDLGLESTVLDPNSEPVLIYRPGAITLEQVRSVDGAAEMFAPPEAVMPDEERRLGLPSPGVGLRHYAPEARLILTPVSASGFSEQLQAALLANPGERVGVMLPEEFVGAVQGLGFARSRLVIYAWGRWSQPEELAHRLFSGLRTLDQERCSVILCPEPAGSGIESAIRDRLRKAARPA